LTPDGKIIIEITLAFNLHFSPFLVFKFTFFKKTSLVAFFVSLVFLSTSFYLFFPQPTLAQSRPIAIIRVATLTSKSDSTLIVDQQGQTLTINTDVQTLFRRRVGGNSSLDEMQNGDSLSIVGFWEDEPRTTVYARMVRDLSVEIRTGTFTGTVTSLFGNGFVISYLNREPVNVTITPDAQLLNRKNEPIALSDILTDHRVQVRGTYNRQQQAINQVTQVRDTSLPSSGSTLRLPIAIIRQAILNSISDTTLSVTQGDQPLTILTNDQTRLRRRLGGDSSLTEMQPGDSLSIVGWYTDDIRTTVQARLVRDLSIEIRTGTFSGKVVSVSDDSFIFTYLKNNLTVTVESQTQIINRLGNPITLADLQPDHRVRVRGTYNGQQQTITQVTEVRDFDLPQRSSVSRMPIAIINQANLESKDGATRLQRYSNIHHPYRSKYSPSSPSGRRLFH
jgi:hypothetical protein